MNRSGSEFSRRVDRICLAALRNSESLSNALRSCEGLFPTLAIKKFMELDPKRTKSWLLDSERQMRIGMNPIQKNSSFTLSTWDFNVEKLKSLSSVAWSPGSRVCLMGTPSLLPYLPSSSDNTYHLLVDLRAPLNGERDGLVHLSYDIGLLNGTEFSSSFDTCFIDPPWYLANYFKWIDLAKSYCRNGGRVVFALLGALTRPSAESDRETILDYCNSIGFSIELHRNFVLYDPPAFESHILRRAGIPAIPWKVADLVVATLNQDKVSTIQTPSLTPLKPFRQIDFGDFIVEVVFDRFEAEPPELVSVLGDGYWMETPSRRERGLLNCNVFTSNGARFFSPRPIELFSELQLLKGANATTLRLGLSSLGFPADVVKSSMSGLDAVG